VGRVGTRKIPAIKKFHLCRRGWCCKDFTGVPCVVDLGVDARRGGGGWAAIPKKINPLQQVDLVIDHSVASGSFSGTPTAFAENVRDRIRTQQRNAIRFLRWGQKSFPKISRVVAARAPASCTK